MELFTPIPNRIYAYVRSIEYIIPVKFIEKQIKGGNGSFQITFYLVEFPDGKRHLANPQWLIEYTHQEEGVKTFLEWRIES